MNFRLANSNDIEIVSELYSLVKGSKYCTWNDEYPTKLDAEYDFNSFNLFVLEDNGIVIGAISKVKDNELDDLKCWSFYEETCEFARVVINPNYHRRGYSKYLVINLLDELSKRDFKHVHISVAKRNVPANKLYKSLQFRIVGEEEMYGNLYYLMEREIV